MIGALTLPIVGIQAWLDYVATLSGLRDVSAGEHNLSFATTAHAFGLPGPDGLWVLLGIAIAGIASACGGAPTRCRDGGGGLTRPGRSCSSRSSIPHYLVQLLIPAAFLAGRGSGGASCCRSSAGCRVS